MTNTFFCFASNKPNKFGVYHKYYCEDVLELYSHYEEDFKSAIKLLDVAHLTRFA